METKSYSPNDGPQRSGDEDQRSYWPLLLWIGLVLAVLLLLLLLFGCRRPDLTVDVIELSLTQELTCDGVQAQDHSVDVRVLNPSQRPAGAFSVNLNSESQTVDGLAAGETVVLSFAVDPTEPLLAIVDSDGQITESDEDNNTDEVTVETVTTILAEVACQPDLVLVPDCSPGADVPIRWRAENRGNFDVSAPLELDVNGTVFELDGLAAGEDLIFDDYDPGDAADITAAIDPNNLIEERHEDNNEVTVAAAECATDSTPPAELSVLLTAGWSCQNPAAIIGSLIVINSGGLASGPFAIALTGTEIPDDPGVATGESRTIPIAIPVAPETNETITIEVTVDADNAINEFNEDNNTQATMVVVDVPSCSEVGDPDLPDLTITLNIPDLVVPCDGLVPTTAQAAITVMNQGPVNAGPFVVEVAGQTESFEGLMTGASSSRDITVDATLTTFEAEVDSGRTVEESNEANNSASATLNKVEPEEGCDPTPTPTNLTIALGCSHDAVNNQTIVAVVTHNVGVTGAGPFAVFINGTNFQQPGLAAGAESRIDVRFPYGTANVFALTDVLNQVPETNEDDNRSRLTVTDPVNDHCQKRITPPCTRFDFEIGRQSESGSLSSGTLSAYEVVTGRHIVSWYAQRGHRDSGWLDGDDLSFDEVWVYVDFKPDFGNAVRLEMLNPAGGTEHGWLKRGICHALEIQFPE